MKEAYIDRIFRGYGESAFGKTRMDLISSAEVEDARCKAMKALGDLTACYGLQERGTTERLFCEYIAEKLAAVVKE